MRISSSARTACPRRARSAITRSSTSSRSATARWAAAVGVGARTSATKSAMVKSVSCPTPLMTGIGQDAMARTTGSSLNAHKSSILPPPRTSKMTSTAFSFSAAFNAEIIPAGASGPCTKVG